MTTTSVPKADRFREQNEELFTQRDALRHDLEHLHRLDHPDAATRRRIRILRRRIDEVTEQIVECNMGLVRSYTRRFAGSASRDRREDFEAAGLLGLIRAVESYDADAGAFGQWAFQPIRREVLRAVRDNDHPNLNIGDFEKRPAILAARRQLQAIDEDYRPSDEEIAAVAGATVAQVRRVLAPPRVESLQKYAGDEEETSLGDLIPCTQPSPDVMVMSQLTLAALETYGPKALNERELFVIVRRYGLDREPPEKLADIGRALGLSREAVRQIEVKALARLQHPTMLRRLQAVHDVDRAALARRRVMPPPQPK